MSYEASYNGFLFLKKEEDWSNDDIKALTKLLEVNHSSIQKFVKRPNLHTLLNSLFFSECFLEFTLVEQDNFVEILLNGSNENYHADSWYAVLQSLSPILLKGSEIDFIGQEGDMWRFIAHQDRHCCEENGHVVYDEYPVTKIS